MPAVAEWLRQAYPALLELAGVGSIPTNSDAQHVPSFRRWRFEMKLSPCFDAHFLQDFLQTDKLNFHVHWKGFHLNI